VQCLSIRKELIVVGVIFINNIKGILAKSPLVGKCSKIKKKMK